MVAIFFVAGVLLFVGFFASNTINQAFLDSGYLDDYDDAKESVTTIKGHSSLMDYAFLFFVLAFLLAMPIASYFTPTHPATFVAFIFIFFLALTISVILSDTFTEIGESEQLSESYGQMPLLRNLMYYLPLLIIMSGVITGSILYGKARAGGGEY